MTIIPPAGCTAFSADFMIYIPYLNGGYHVNINGVQYNFVNANSTVGFHGFTSTQPITSVTFVITGAGPLFSIAGAIDNVTFGGNQALAIRPQVAAPKAIGKPKCGCVGDASAVGDPITLGFGNLFDEVTDYTTAGANPLSFTRYYNSLGTSNTAAVSLGVDWRSTYDRYLQILPGAIYGVIGGTLTVVAERPDGQQLTFNFNGNSWVPDSDVDLKLFQTGSGWILTDNEDNTEYYNTSGILGSIQARDGYAQTMSYNSSNQLASVSDSFGRTLQFAYQGNLLQTVTAPSGLTINYSYSSPGASFSQNRLKTVVYSTTPQTSQSYLYESFTLPFALTGIVDENGNRFATWGYDSAGRANSSQHAGGADLTTIVYNADGSRTVTSPLGLQSVYKFVTLQGVPKLTEVDRLATSNTPACKMTQSYDANGYLNGITDWNTNVTSKVNDVHNQPLVINEAVGTVHARSITSIFHTTYHLPVQITAPNKTTSFNYDTNGNPLTRTETDTTTGTVPYSTSGQTRTWTNTFDSFGHVLSVTGPRTDATAITSFAYDISNNLTSVTDPLGHLSRLTNYNGSGLPLTMIDPNGVVTAFTYDVRDRLLSRVVQAASGNATNVFAYDAAGELTTVTLPDGSFLGYQYDAAHRLQSVSNSLGETISYQLDAMGNITNQTIRNAAASISKTQGRVFDQLGRMLKDIGASAQTTTYGYDSLGNLLSLKDGLTNATAYAFDSLNRLVSVVDPLNNTNQYGYDLEDNRTNVTDPRSLATGYVFDGFGHVIQETSPDKGITVYHLDKAGNRTNEVDARDIVTLRTFDKLNRVTAKTFPASSGENITYSYDSTNGSNFGIGRLTGYTDETGSTTLKYNERGDMVSTTRTISGQAYTTSYAYNIADNITNIVYPSGHVISFGRDGQGRISSVTYRPSVGGVATILASNVSYAPFGPIYGVVYGNGLVRSNNYDLDYRLTGLTTQNGGVYVQNLGYGYNAVNNITAITDNLTPGNNQSFGYDKDYRLTQASGDYGLEGYSYDADGNRLSRSAGGATERYNYGTNANRLLSTVKSGITRSFGYVTNGNLMSDNRGTSTNLVFGYSNRNRYKTLTSGSSTIATYNYNALGERLVKTVGSTATVYHFDESGHLIAESQANGTLIHEYVWLNDMPLAQIESSGTIYYIHPDHLNRPQKMTDANENIVWDNQPQPFGEVGLSFYLPTGGYNASKQFQINIGGLSTYNCIVQSSTNLITWVSLATNAGPFTFTDASTASHRYRFYRVLYSPTSAAVGTITNNLRFPGQYYDAESGLNYNMMRDYDPTLGRYVQADPIGLLGGVNLYVYIQNQPVRRFDQTGTLMNVSPIWRVITIIAQLALSNPDDLDNPNYRQPDNTLSDAMEQAENNQSQQLLPKNQCIETQMPPTETPPPPPKIPEIPWWELLIRYPLIITPEQFYLIHQWFLPAGSEPST